MSTPLERYQDDLQRPDFIRDFAQEQAVRELQDLYDRLLQQRIDSQSWSRRIAATWRRQQPLETGLYFWGGVGRGKTYLMDTFFECLPFDEKLRVHFHRFMQRVHRELAELEGEKNPLDVFMSRLADETQIICFDEFFVSDIADAMILANCLRAMFEKGITLVATSNIEPSGLYKDGLQRSRFLPAIALLEQHTKILNVDAGTDYRLRTLEQATLFYSPLGAEAEASLQASYLGLTGASASGDTVASLEVNGRQLQCRRLSEGVVWFDFKALCDGPRSQNDYIEIAREFHTVLLSDIPKLHSAHDDMCRRFINLVDEFYDRHVKFIVSAATAVAELYDGERLSFEFQRTVSRLLEMQSHEYLALEHRP
ncbi:MAG: cell division protein ZapE [Pseudomonadota bacterium]